MDFEHILILIVSAGIGFLLGRCETLDSIFRARDYPKPMKDDSPNT